MGPFADRRPKAVKCHQEPDEVGSKLESSIAQVDSSDHLDTRGCDGYSGCRLELGTRNQVHKRALHNQIKLQEPAQLEATNSCLTKRMYKVSGSQSEAVADQPLRQQLEQIRVSAKRPIQLVTEVKTNIVLVETDGNNEKKDDKQQANWPTIDAASGKSEWANQKRESQQIGCNSYDGKKFQVANIRCRQGCYASKANSPGRRKSRSSSLIRQRLRVSVAASAISLSSINLLQARMRWPSWRLVALLGSLMFVLTSLLALFDGLVPLASSSASSCLLFKHCHALTLTPTNDLGKNEPNMAESIGTTFIKQTHKTNASSMHHKANEIQAKLAPEMTTTPTTATLSTPKLNINLSSASPKMLNSIRQPTNESLREPLLQTLAQFDTNIGPLHLVAVGKTSTVTRPTNELTDNLNHQPQQVQKKSTSSLMQQSLVEALDQQQQQPQQQWKYQQKDKQLLDSKAANLLINNGQGFVAASSLLAAKEQPIQMKPIASNKLANNDMDTRIGRPGGSIRLVETSTARSGSDESGRGASFWLASGQQQQQLKQNNRLEDDQRNASESLAARKSVDGNGEVKLPTSVVVGRRPGQQHHFSASTNRNNANQPAAINQQQQQPVPRFNSQQQSENSKENQQQKVPVIGLIGVQNSTSNANLMDEWTIDSSMVGQASAKLAPLTSNGTNGRQEVQFATNWTSQTSAATVANEGQNYKQFQAEQAINRSLGSGGTGDASGSPQAAISSPISSPTESDQKQRVEAENQMPILDRGATLGSGLSGLFGNSISANQVETDLDQADEELLAGALSDLMASAAGEPLFAAENPIRDNQMLISDGSHNKQQLKLIDLRHFLASDEVGTGGLNLQGEPKPSTTPSSSGHRHHLASTASASAPSVSLPPLSHLLVPRNPFRLFASTSSPASMATRYFPNLIGTRQQQPQQSASNLRHIINDQKHQRLSIKSWLIGPTTESSSGGQHLQTQASRTVPATSQTTSGNHDNTYQNNQQILRQISHQRDPPPFQALNSFQGGSSLSGLDGLIGGDESMASSPVYAHSRSAEQLERLVQAALRSHSNVGIGHSSSASPILPAIVSSSTGQTMPGFYIPAIESPPSNNQNFGDHSGFQESQLNKFRFGLSSPVMQTSASSISQLDEGASLVSKIPGTDYILHPDEVRAMMNIGELAWQQRKQQPEYSNDNAGHQQTVASSSDINQQSIGDGHDDGIVPFGGANLMQENHAENARNYAYTESSSRFPELFRHQQHSASAGGLSHQLKSNASNQSHTDHSGNGQQTNDGSNGNQSPSSAPFPAIIRVNDQDYVHWPLIRVQNEQKKFSSMKNSLEHDHTANGPGLAASSTESHQQNSRPQQYHQLGQTRPAQANTRPSVMGHSMDQMLSHHHEHSPVRLATQLTPGEINQVENSILETLIMAQTLEHQRKMMRALAASDRQPMYPSGASSHHYHQKQASLLWPAKWLSQLELGSSANKQHHQMGKQNTYKSSRGFFSRRRRNSAPTNNGKQTKTSAGISETSQQQRASDLNTPMASSNHQHFVSLVPVLNPLTQQASQLSTVLRDHLSLSEPLEHYISDQESFTPLTSGVSSTTKANNFLKELSPLESMVVESKIRAPSPSSNLMNEHPTNLKRTQSLIHSGSQSRLMNPIIRQVTSTKDDGELVFGNRVPKAPAVAPSKMANKFNQPKDFSSLYNDESRYKAFRSSITKDKFDEKFSTNNKMSSQPSPVNRQQVVAFVPVQDNRSRQVALYTGQAAPRTSDRNGNHLGTNLENLTADLNVISSQSKPNRINVDWPAMVSDADYFPPVTSSNSGSHTNEEFKESKSGQVLAASSDRSRSHQHLGSHPTTATTIQQPATRRGKFVVSQMKLRFTEDYQAREGVPNYNNNVRVAGNLDRQRGLTTGLIRQSSNVGNSGDGNYRDEYNSRGIGGEELVDYNSDDGDLDKGSSSVDKQKVAVTSINDGRNSTTEINVE